MNVGDQYGIIVRKSLSPRGETMTRLLVATFIAVLLVASAFADDPKLPGVKIDLPDVEGFTRSKIHIYEKESFGYSASYSTPGIVVTLYVYNNGHSEIPDGPKSQVVKQEMKLIADGLEEAKKQGSYKSVKELGEEEIVSLGKGKDAPTARRRQFLVERTKEGEKYSDAYVTGYKDHFIKLRITYDLENKDESKKKIAALLEAVGSALK
jgi:hypothetical protein